MHGTLKCVAVTPGVDDEIVLIMDDSWYTLSRHSNSKWSVFGVGWPVEDVATNTPEMPVATLLKILMDYVGTWKIEIVDDSHIEFTLT